MRKTLVFSVVHLCSYMAIVNASSAQDAKIYQVDRYGNTQYHKPHIVIKNNRAYQSDPYGNIQYYKPHAVIKKDRAYESDPYGNTQWHKPGYKIQKTDK